MKRKYIGLIQLIYTREFITSHITYIDFVRYFSKITFGRFIKGAGERTKDRDLRREREIVTDTYRKTEIEEDRDR